MKARPILFSAAMIRALLDGRKTQTRRTKGLEFFSRPENEPDRWWCARVRDGVAFFVFDKCPNEREVKCPYGKPGDLLWVRETHALVGNVDPPWVLYRASGYENECRRHKFNQYPAESEITWKPSIHMPRWASRLTLRITNIRVERLQEISEADAKAEGVEAVMHKKVHGWTPHVLEYSLLWDRLNGKDAWRTNPWVWALTFDVIKANVDQVMKKVAA